MLYVYHCGFFTDGGVQTYNDILRGVQPLWSNCNEGGGVVKKVPQPLPKNLTSTTASTTTSQTGIYIEKQYCIQYRRCCIQHQPKIDVVVDVVGIQHHPKFPPPFFNTIIKTGSLQGLVQSEIQICTAHEDKPFSLYYMKISQRYNEKCTSCT